ncbi:hypothetical protein BH11BAC1_BH11BAC1_19580 [soil metagenome]
MAIERMRQLLIIIYLLFANQLAAQNRNSNWCFGDSAGVHFNGSQTSLFTSSVKCRGSCASISDSTGALLFYYSYAPDGMINGHPFENGNVYTKEHRIMTNGDLVVSGLWYQEGVIIPLPGDSHKYYLFTVGVTGNYGLYYSIIDMSIDSGRGSVIQKNVQLHSFQASDCVVAIRHGNGRDWWILSKRWDATNDEFLEYIVTPTGITSMPVQNAGAFSGSNVYRLASSKDGTKIVGTTSQGLIELFDFDQCSGIITIDQHISSEVALNLPFYWSSEFSPSGRFLYVTRIGIDMSNSFLIQFDLSAADIFNSADTIWVYNSTPEACGAIKLAPDNKIYLSSAWEDSVNFNYPYPDSAFNTVNNNLSVINFPDSAGTSCDFTPFSFNLGTGRCYWGLPNNPDYELGPDTNSFCDTILQTKNIDLVPECKLSVYYNPEWKEVFINASGLHGSNCVLRIYDLNGREIYAEVAELSSQFYFKELNCSAFAKGVYFVSIQTQTERLAMRFIKE